MVAISSWGRLNLSEHEVISIYNHCNLKNLLCSKKTGLAYGMGRSYGDVCLNPGGILWKSTSLDRFISFDEKNGRLICEAGVLLKDINELTLPRGWLLPVVPGTQYVTVGGAIANDIHGKNHHVCGTFGEHIHQLTLARTDGNVIQCGPHLNTEWFAATVGGLGLTGFISIVELQLRPVNGPWLDVEIIPYYSLSEFFKLARVSENDWEYTVSWVDCLSTQKSRGIFMRANHINDEAFGRVSHKWNLRMPDLPTSCVNRFTLKLLNTLYFSVKKNNSGLNRMHYQSFFYPLDNLSEWNRIYGRKGFYQYQSLIPSQNQEITTQAMIDEIAKSSEGSFLSVLKTFGKRNSVGMLSFPKAGATLALDFPNKGLKTLKLFERLDEIVYAAGGRIYPAKDSRMPVKLFESGYGRLSEFSKYRDPGISSAMSRRLMGQ